MEDLINNLQVSLSQEAPRLLWGLGILLLGIIIAWIVRTVVQSLLNRTGVDERLSRRMAPEQRIDLSSIISQVLFWFIILMAIVAALDALELRGFADPFRNIINDMAGFLPNLIGALVLVGVAWLVATLVKRLIQGALNATDWDERFRRTADVDTTVDLGSSLGNLAYWLVWLFFLPGILGALGIEGLLVPVQNMLNQLVGFLPNLLSAIVIAVVGYFVAKIVSDIVTNLLASSGVDRYGERVGFGRGPSVAPDTTVRTTAGATPAGTDGTMRLSSLIGTLVFILILLPVLISALDALQLEALSRPATDMLNRVLSAIPAIFAAGVVLAIAWFVGRLLADLVSSLLAGIGFNRLVTRAGLRQDVTGGRQPSELVGTLVFIALMLFAAVEAANLLGFDSVSALLGQVLVLLGNVLLGLIVFGVGLYLANLAANLIRDSNIENSNLLATIARYAIIVLVAFMALEQMGIGEEIVSTAFTLLLGALAVAAALAFGLGGRDMAARTLERMRDQIDESEPPPTTPDPF